MRTDAFKLASVPEIEQVVECIMPPTRSHLSGRETSDVELCPWRLYALSVREPKPFGVAECVDHLAEKLMGMAMELREAALEVRQQGNKIREVLLEALE